MCCLRLSCSSSLILYRSLALCLRSNSSVAAFCLWAMACLRLSSTRSMAFRCCARQNSSILACLALASAVLTLFWPWDPRSRHLKLCEGAGHGLLFSAVCPQPEEGSSEAALTTETLVQLMFRRCLPRTWAPAGSLAVPVASEADALRLCRRTLPALKDLPALPAPA